MNAEPEIIDFGPIETMHTLRVQFGQYGASRPALAALARLATALHVPAGVELTRNDGPVGMVYFVVKGSLRVSRGGKHVRIVAERDAFGAVAAKARDMRASASIAVTDTVVLAIRAEDLLEVLEDHFDVMHAALRRLAHVAIEMRRTLMPHAGFSNELRDGFDFPARPLDLAERILGLRRTFGPELGYIDELAQIARAAEEVRYPEGTSLWSVGDHAGHMLVLLSGVVQGRTHAGAVFRMGPRDILGSLDVISGQPRWFYAVVMQDLVALKLDGEILIDVWEDHPDLAFAFLRIVAASQISLSEQETV